MSSNNLLDWEDHQVDHLFLLIGENPLPNYVAARLMLKQGGTPYLVHTTDTEKEAKRLETILSDEGVKTTQLVSLNDYESDAYQIREAIRPKLEAIKDGKIGLNYTGGTKAMAVHTYRSLFYEKIMRDQRIYYEVRPNVIFSYLDPRKLEMCIDREDGDRIRLKVKPELLEVKLETLFQIHGLKLEGKPTQKAQLPQLAATFAEVFKDGKKEKQWFDWYDNVFCQEARKEKKKNGDRGDWQSKTKLAALSLSFEKLPPEIHTEFKRENLIDSEGKVSLQAVQQLKNEKEEPVFKEIRHFCDYLDGLWLEHHVLQQVKNIANQNSIKDYGNDFDVPLSGTEQGFQFDVAFTRGYQLFAISISTSKDRKLCKSKLFEAYIRARQMGGDEARVALVCCTNEPDTLKAEMALIGDKKIAVFGREHLMDLQKKIEEWIKQADKDAR